MRANLKTAFLLLAFLGTAAAAVRPDLRPGSTVGMTGAMATGAISIADAAAGGPLAGESAALHGDLAATDESTGPVPVGRTGGPKGGRRNPENFFGTVHKETLEGLSPRQAYRVVEKMVYKLGLEKEQADALFELITSVHRTREILKSAKASGDDTDSGIEEVGDGGDTDGAEDPMGAGEKAPILDGKEGDVLAQFDTIPDSNAAEVIAMMLGKLKLDGLEVDALVELVGSLQRAHALVVGVTTGRLRELAVGHRKGGTLSSIPPQNREKVRQQRLQEDMENASLRSFLGQPYATSLLATTPSATSAAASTSTGAEGKPSPKLKPFAMPLAKRPPPKRRMPKEYE